EMSGDIAFDGETVSTVIIHTQFGVGWMVAIGACVVLVVLGITGRMVSWPAVVPAAALISIGVFSSHMASHGAPFGIPALIDGLHVFAAAIWVGGLVAFALVLRDAPHDRATAVTRVFSRNATLAVIVLLLTGAFSALTVAGSVGALFDSSYGAVLF